VQRLLTLVELRRTHPAFDGEWWLAPARPSAPGLIETGWRCPTAATVTLTLDARAPPATSPSTGSSGRV
jgi:hypothetical protein